MVRRKTGDTSVLVEPSPANPAESLAPVASITASLKQSLGQNARREPDLAPAADSRAIVGEARGARVLVYLESEPSASESEFLAKMLSAIQIPADQLAIEWGDFPEAKASVALGIGLAPKKAARLVALRPDRFELPPLSAIQSDSAVKREAWEKLKQLAARLKEFS